MVCLTKLFTLWGNGIHVIDHIVDIVHVHHVVEVIVVVVDVRYPIGWLVVV